MEIILLLLVCVVPLASVLYWLRYHAGLFATEEQSKRYDAIDQEIDGPFYGR